MNPAASIFAGCKPMTRREIAARLAGDIPEGWYVNLGIGAPLQVADYVPEQREVVFQSENGILGMGPAPAPDKINRWLINAGKQYITLRTGGSYMHHADSFGAHSRRPSRSMCARRVSSRREWRHRQLGDVERHRARGWRRHGSCGRNAATVGADGAHDQDRRKPAGPPLRISADRNRRGQAHLHQPRRDRCHRRRLCCARDGARADARRVAARHRRAAADGGVRSSPSP